MAQAKRSAAENIVRVDPKLTRPRNEEQTRPGESLPESPVPKVVRTSWHRKEPGPAVQARVPPDRWQRIQRRAYEIAQARGFAPGAELNDWLQAEREIDSESARGARQTSPEDQFTG